MSSWSRLYSIFFEAYGAQHWWPGRDNTFEVVVGAVLTQRTVWTNASTAVNRLREAKALSVEAILGMGSKELETHIRSAGFYRAKAATLKQFCEHAAMANGLSQFLSLPKQTLRSELLSIRGIGQETADAILVYAAGLPSFIVDAYTRRLLKRLRWIAGHEPYHEIQAAFTSALPRDADVYGELHALIVHHGKTVCRARPKCQLCPMISTCDFAQCQEAH